MREENMINTKSRPLYINNWGLISAHGSRGHCHTCWLYTYNVNRYFHHGMIKKMFQKMKTMDLVGFITLVLVSFDNFCNIFVKNLIKYKYIWRMSSFDGSCIFSLVLTNFICWYAVYFSFHYIHIFLYFLWLILSVVELRFR